MTVELPAQLIARRTAVIQSGNACGGGRDVQCTKPGPLALVPDTAGVAEVPEAAWHATGQAGVPLIVAPDGDLLVGCVPAEDTAGFFHRKGT